MNESDCSEACAADVGHLSRANDRVLVYSVFSGKATMSIKEGGGNRLMLTSSARIKESEPGTSSMSQHDYTSWRGPSHVTLFTSAVQTWSCKV